MVEGKPVAAVAPAPGTEDLGMFCQPCSDELGEPTKTMGSAKMWIKKQEGRQMMRIDIKAGFDWQESVRPHLPGKPEWCPATHFGYLESGEMGVKMKDGTTKTIKAGHSYFIPPGARPATSPPPAARRPPPTAHRPPTHPPTARLPCVQVTSP